MEPRFRGCRAVLARSFARIAETNLKKQGVLALTFIDPADYDEIGEDDRISIVGLDRPRPRRARHLRACSDPTGRRSTFATSHTLSLGQIEWFQAGSALNLIRAQVAGG